MLPIQPDSDCDFVQLDHAGVGGSRVEPYLDSICTTSQTCHAAAPSQAAPSTYLVYANDAHGPLWKIGEKKLDGIKRGKSHTINSYSPSLPTMWLGSGFLSHFQTYSVSQNEFAPKRLDHHLDRVS